MVCRWFEVRGCWFSVPGDVFGVVRGRWRGLFPRGGGVGGEDGREWDSEEVLVISLRDPRYSRVLPLACTCCVLDACLAPDEVG